MKNNKINLLLTKKDNHRAIMNLKMMMKMKMKNKYKPKNKFKM